MDARAGPGSRCTRGHRRYPHATRHTGRKALRHDVRSSPAGCRTSGRSLTLAGGRRGVYEASPRPRFSISSTTMVGTDRHRSPRSCGNSRAHQAAEPAAGVPATRRPEADTGPAPASLADERRRGSMPQLHNHEPPDLSAGELTRERSQPSAPPHRRWRPATDASSRTWRSRSAHAPRPQK